MLNDHVKAVIVRSGFLRDYGAWLLVDGQFGSTGKGLISSVLAEALGDHYSPNVVLSNAGPNSGHTSYGPDDEKIVLMQLPTFAVAAQAFYKKHPHVHLTAGAVLDIDRLHTEIEQYLTPFSVTVDPSAAVVTKAAKGIEAGLVGEIGSTGKGTGGAIARKVLREPMSTAGEFEMLPLRKRAVHDPHNHRMFMEVSQGYSLSLNASGMFPYTTSRDCTVMQAMADANLHPQHYRGCMMTVRTFPIRVAGNSGPMYPDQVETSWEALGVAPEFTTVTMKTRRVFTWSDIQFVEALKANRPCSLFINFVQYLPSEEREPFIAHVIELYRKTLDRRPRLVLAGYGPKNHDVKLVAHV